MAIRVLLLPVSTAVVERSFSSMNRVMTVDWTKLTDDHLDDMMFISIEGPAIPNPRKKTTSEYNNYTIFISNVPNAHLQNRHKKLERDLDLQFIIRF